MGTKKLIILFTLLLTSHLVSARVISLTTTITADIMSENTARLHVKLLNSGDEAAHNVQISSLTEDFKTDLIYAGILEPNVPFEGDLNISRTKEINPGSYPIVVLTDYADNNGYPFSSISPAYLTYKTHTVTKVSGIIPELTLAGKESKKLVLTVRNLDNIPHDVKVKLFLPRELKTVDEERSLSIGSKEEKTLNFDVSSFSALSGSSYVVLASLEYEQDGLHYSSFAQSIINITEKKSPSIPFWLPILTFFVLLIIFVYYFIKRR
ncbi:MAG: hypothetical protein QMD36_03590 [Candidatus Aenigmarchaeota archaeon]|nr:hypothetical protein [Candidatus Aenigmarchaeota archaeon]